jgi:biotin transport system substrate-specific component
MQNTFTARTTTASDWKSLSTSLPGRVILIVGASVLVAASAHLSVPLFFTPVPLTLQTFAVILVGLALGPSAAFSALALYLVEGAVGLPVFSPNGPGGLAQLLGPTAGYLLSYPFAAAVAGYLARRSSLIPNIFLRGTAAGTAAAAIYLTSGTAWLASLHHLGAGTAVLLAVAPFLPGEIVKIIAAAGIFRAIRRPAQA